MSVSHHSGVSESHGIVGSSDTEADVIRMETLILEARRYAESLMGKLNQPELEAVRVPMMELLGEQDGRRLENMINALSLVKGLLTVHDPKPRTVIGLLGTTGSGKSTHLQIHPSGGVQLTASSGTALNSLLDGLISLPTSALGACTAVPVEVGWREPGEMEHHILAEITFISMEDYEKEREQLLLDLETEDGHIKPFSSLSMSEDNEESVDARTAKDKFEALYTDFQISSFRSVQDLRSKLQSCETAIGLVEILRAGCRTLICRNKQEFQDQVQPYMEPRAHDISTGIMGQQWWPIVKCIKCVRV